ncbi:MAG: hypothetical protein KME06_07480 [Kastovskya adunca ATA6-11-RM4]|jgi:predicted nucleic acid-binding protein|nr:hypothetical protein [Kastovskya adunca ATA6-11-RM4]
MFKDSQDILAILKPRRIPQIVALFIKVLWIYVFLIIIQNLFNPELTSFMLFSSFFGAVFYSFIFWVILNTIDTSLQIRSNGILMRGLFWKTYLPWDSVKEIKLINGRNERRSAEIYAKHRKFGFNKKVSFDSSLHRNFRHATYYLLYLAEQYKIPVKTGRWSLPLSEWKAWASVESPERLTKIGKRQAELLQEQEWANIMSPEQLAELEKQQELLQEEEGANTISPEQLAEIEKLKKLLQEQEWANIMSSEQLAEIEKRQQQLQEKEAMLAQLSEQLSSQVPGLKPLEVGSLDMETVVKQCNEALEKAKNVETETLASQCLETLFEVEQIKGEILQLQLSQYLNSL